MTDKRAAYDEVYAYTFGRPGFIVQYVADAFTVQKANAHTKPIAVVFGLIGLYLHIEKQFSGFEVQKAHKDLVRRNRTWPYVTLPQDRGAITVFDVLSAAPGIPGDAAIDDWCRSVWTACAENREDIIDLLHEYRVLAKSN